MIIILIFLILNHLILINSFSIGLINAELNNNININSNSDDSNTAFDRVTIKGKIICRNGYSKVRGYVDLNVPYLILFKETIATAKIKKNSYRFFNQKIDNIKNMYLKIFFDCGEGDEINTYDFPDLKYLEDGDIKNFTLYR